MTQLITICLLISLAVQVCLCINSNMLWQFVNTQGFHPQRGIADPAIWKGPGNTMGIFGGLNEAIAINVPGQNTNDYFNTTFIFNATTQTWTLVHNGDGGPVARAFSCASYHAGTNKAYLFGGAVYTATFDSFTFYNDLWSFDLSTFVWTQLSPSGTIPSTRAAHACSIVADSLYVFSGGEFTFENDLWKYNITSNAWVLVQAPTNATNVPMGRNQHYLDTIPGHNQLILHAGESFISIPDPPFGIAVTLNDVWIYTVSSNTWTELDNTDHPTVKHTQQAHVMVNERYLVLQNGDAQGNRTVDDTCLPPLVCFLPASPTADTYAYDIQREKFFKLDLPAVPPPTRRSKMTIIGDSLYLIGGYGWDGAHGVGRIDNPYTWKLTLKGVLANDEF
jgi:hypothetical protein